MQVWLFLWFLFLEKPTIVDDTNLKGILISSRWYIHRPHQLEKLLVTPFCLSSIVWAWLTFLDRVIRSGVGLISCKASYVANTGSKCRKRIKDGFITNNLCNTLFFFASASLFSVTTSLFLNLHLSSSLKRSTSLVCYNK